MSEPDGTGCRIWTGYVNPATGYGLCAPFDPARSPEGAHRVAFQVFNGPIPDGKEVSHTCDKKLCVERTHLVAETHAENMARARGPRGAVALGQRRRRERERRERRARVEATR
jgi:hypothetical protein